MPVIKSLCPILTFSLIYLLTACNTEKKSAVLLTGKWSNLELKVLVNHASSEDSAYTFMVPHGEWEQILNIKPILTEFKSNGTYTSEYRSLQDSLIRETDGTWDIIADTLILIEDGTSSRYHFKIEGSEVTFKGWLDWDQDGEMDDLYSGRQVKINH